MSSARNHHYISQFYLKGFTKSGGKKSNLHVFDKRQSKYFKASPRNVAAKRDFNRISVDGYENHIEDELAKTEGELAHTFNEMIKNKRYPNNDQMMDILHFIALVALRNPKMRELFDNVYKQIAETIMNITVSTKESYESQVAQMNEYMGTSHNVDYEEMKKFIEEKRYKLEINQEQHIPVEFNTIESILPILEKRNWYLIISNEEMGEFVTSDFPVTLISLIDRGPYGVGFGLSKTEVSFPISRYLALVGVFETYSLSNTIFATKDMVASINGRTVAYAKDQIYSAHKQFEYLDVDDKIKSSEILLKKE